jgi:DNA-directed RNA polymerase subunit M/transcription elongation factor TFIIS
MAWVFICDCGREAHLCHECGSMMKHEAEKVRCLNCRASRALTDEELAQPKVIY